MGEIVNEYQKRIVCCCVSVCTFIGFVYVRGGVNMSRAESFVCDGIVVVGA